MSRGATSKSVICSETEVEMHRIIYNWDINNFDRICTPESEEFEPISSTPFRAGQEINRDSEWDLILSAEGGYLQIWLYLKKIFNEMIKDISVNLTVLILKADGSTLLRRRCDKNQTFTAEDNGWGMGFIITIETLWEERDNYLQDNKLRLQIQLDILGELTSRFKTPGLPGSLLLSRPGTNSTTHYPTSGKRKRSHEDPTDTHHPTDPPEDPGSTLLKKHMRKLLKSQHNTDMRIECGKKSFPVHKIILAARSPVFSAMFQHDNLETRSAVVKIPDVPESTMERLLEYIYTGAVTPNMPGDVEEVMSLVEASDKYQMVELKNRCMRGLCGMVGLENVGRVVVLGWMRNAEVGLQEELRGYCRSNWDLLLKKKSFKDALIGCPRAFFDDITGLAEGGGDGGGTDSD